MREHDPISGTRGRYRKSQEADAFALREVQRRRMERLITDDGIVRFGKFIGQHFKKMTPSYILWANENIEGFPERHALLVRSYGCNFSRSNRKRKKERKPRQSRGRATKEERHARRAAKWEARRKAEAESK